MAKEYLLVDISTKNSTRGTGDYIYEVDFIDLDDFEYYTTTVDPTMRNWTRCNWNTICYGDIPYGVYTGLIRTAKKTKENTRVISADSYPQCLSPLSADETTELVSEIILKKNMK